MNEKLNDLMCNYPCAMQYDELIKRVENLENLFSILTEQVKMSPEMNKKLDNIEQFFSPAFREFCQ